MRKIMVVNEIFRHRFLINFNKYRFLLIELVKRDIKVKYRNSILGIFWSFLNPLLMMVVMTIIFSTLFGKQLLIFLFTIYPECLYLPSFHREVVVQ